MIDISAKDISLPLLNTDRNLINLRKELSRLYGHKSKLKSLTINESKDTISYTFELNDNSRNESVDNVLTTNFILNKLDDYIFENYSGIFWWDGNVSSLKNAKKVSFYVIKK